jgi:hypothetical protein
MLQEAYRENSLSRAHVFEWHKRFSEGREDVEGDEQSGYLVMMKTDENVDKVRTLVRRDGHLGHYNDSGGNEYVQRNGKTNFNNKFEHEKVCAKMVLENLPVLARMSTNAQTFSILTRP